MATIEKVIGKFPQWMNEEKIFDKSIEKKIKNTKSLEVSKKKIIGNDSC